MAKCFDFAGAVLCRGASAVHKQYEKQQVLLRTQVSVAFRQMRRRGQKHGIVSSKKLSHSVLELWPACLKVNACSIFSGSKGAIRGDKLNCELSATSTLDGLKCQILHIHLPDALLVEVATAQIAVKLATPIVSAGTSSTVSPLGIRARRNKNINMGL